MRINEEITATNVRLIDGEGKQLGIVNIQEALKIAETQGLDLVEVYPDAQSPVTRIMDYGKYIFQQNKQKAQAKKKQKQTQIKEIKFRPTTEEADYQVKLKKLRQFLTDGDKAKITLRFKGRELAHDAIGIKLLQRIEKDLSDIATVDVFPKKTERQMVMIMSPSKN